MKRYYIGNSRLLTHILFWIGYIFIYTSVHIEGRDGMLVYFQEELEGVPAAMFVAYMNLYVLFPYLYAQKKYIAYTIAAVLLLFTGSVLGRVLQEWVFEPTFFADTTTVEPIFIWYMLFKGMLWFLSPVLFFTLLVKILQQSYEREQLHQEIVKEKLYAELNFLKAQVHPHFLFNTLNNLYALTLQSSPIAPTIVLKLSGLMSYMLYDSQNALIDLQKEITHILNYIELEKIRYSERLDVSLNVSGNTDHVSIAPLLLIPFIENAFKHGVSNETDHIWVTVDIKVKDEWLHLKVENSVSDPGSQQAHTSGIGLQNITRRLDLLYPGRHELKLIKEPERYIADLRIKLY